MPTPEAPRMSGNRLSDAPARLGFLLLAIFLFALHSLAQSRIAGPIDNSKLIRLTGNTHPLAQPAWNHGAVDSDFPAGRMILLLHRSADREAALQSFLQQLQNPNAPQYHQYLTPGQFGTQYGLSDADLASVTAWLGSQGFAVTRVLSGRVAIEFSGTAGQVESAFHTAIHSYLLNGEQHYANAADPSIPAALAPVIAGVSLNNFSPRPLNRTFGKALLDPISRRAQPLYNLPAGNDYGCLNGYCYAVAPGDFATIYDTKPLLASGTDGSGVIIGVVGRATIDLANVQQFRQIFLPAYSATNLPNVIVDGPTPTIFASGDQVEAYLDVEEAGAVAPNATVNYYEAADSYVADGISLAIARALDDNQASVLSISYGACEAYLGTFYNQFYSGLFQQAAAQGITVLVATGDSGSAMCDPPFDTSGPSQAISGLAVNGLASTPYNVAVGGTDFYYPAKATTATLGAYWNTPVATDPGNNSDFSSAKSYIPEKPWNLSDPALDQVNFSPSLGAGGGGASSCVVYTGVDTPGDGPTLADCVSGYPKPQWQTGFGADKVRDLPDISLFASNGSNYSFTAICAGPPECAVPNGGPNSVSAPVEVDGVGGTSVAAPSMAGIMALVVQKTQSRQGQANTVLYPLSQQQPQAFHDIAVGGNDVDCLAGSPDCAPNGYLTGYAATAGYDLATGLGSLDAAQLVDNWQRVTFTATASTLAISPTTAVHGTPLSFTVNVTGGPASGDISLLITRSGGSPQGQYTTTCAAFPCTFTYAALPGGSYTVSARYAGSSVYAPSTSAPVPVTITPEPSELAIYYQYGTTATGYVTNINGQTLLYGMEVLFSAKPVPAGYTLPASETSITATPATGSVTVTDNGTALGSTLVLDSTGQALFENGNLAVGAHSLVVSYPGDASYSASTSVAPLATPINFTVGPAISTLTLSPNYQEILPGAGAAVTAYIPIAGQQPPTGSVTATMTSASGSTVLPAVPVTYNSASNSATASINIPASALTIGTPNIGGVSNNLVTATYSGDTNYQAATSRGVGIYDAQAYTNVYAVAAPSAPIVGQSVTITAKVGRSLAYPPYPGFPGGSVSFLDGTSPLGASPTAADAYGNGVASFTTSTLSVGTHTITANYSGDVADQPSTGSFTLVVAAAPPPPPPPQDFTLNGTPISVPSNATNASASSTLSFTLVNPTGAATSFAVTCAAPAQLSTLTCTVPSAVNLAAGATTGSATLSVTIAGTTAQGSPRPNPWPRAAGPLALAFLFPIGLFFRRRKLQRFLVAVSLLAVALGVSSCYSTYTNARVTAGVYNVTVTAAMGTVTHQAAIPVTIQ